jgi:hypothetical protein
VAGWKQVRGGIGPRLVEAATTTFLIVCLAALVIPCVYSFQGFSTWWAGMREVLNHMEMGHPAFFLGQYSLEGWWNYFLVAFLIKTPTGSLVLILTAAVLYRVGKPLRGTEIIVLLVPVVLFFVTTTRGRINIGLRHLLPVYPLLFVFASRLVTVQFRRGWVTPLLFVIPIALTAVSSLRIAPHQLAYFNELVGGPGEGYRYLSDSNLDWGQDLKGIKVYMDQKGLPMIYLAYFGTAPPTYYGIRYQYVPTVRQPYPPPSDILPRGMKREVLAISVTVLQQAFWYQGKVLYHWLYRRIPVAKIGYSIYVYDLTDDADAHLRLAEIYMTVGPHSLAEPELRKVLALEPANREAMQLLSLLSQQP